MKNFILTVFVLSLTISGFAQKNINFNDFDQLTLAGDARKVNNTIQLTPAQDFKKGAVWLKEPVKVADGFVATFKFRTSKNGGHRDGADGIAFVIQNDPCGKKVGSHGEGIGYSGLANSLAVEFDTYNNEEGSDNHVSIQSNGKHKNSHYNKYSLGMTHDVPQLKNETYTAKVIYKDEVLAVQIDGKDILAIDLELEELLELTDGGNAFVGFTSATGGSYAQHDLLDWSFDNKNKGNEVIEIVNGKSKKDKANTTIDVPTVEPTNDRSVVMNKTITVSNETITLRVWDHNRRDGDIISLSLNDRWIVQNYMLNKQPMSFQIPLMEGDNVLVLYANNLGKIPPNTASIRVIDGKDKEDIVLNSDLEKSEGVVIRYEK